MRSKFLSLAIAASSLLLSAAASAPWISDVRDGTFRNPVLFADYSDPDVIRVGDDFYLTASSFQCVPGLPVLHSRDLVNWAIIGHAVERLPERFDTVQHGDGMWAPSLRFHDGWFWIFVGDPDWGVLMTKARDPRGPWTPLHVVHEVKGWIDPCPLWDDDGRAWLVHALAASRTGGYSSVLLVHEMSADGTRVLDPEGKIVVDGRGGRLRVVEGPKFYKRDGWYVILAPAGGVRAGYQMAFRARHPQGPYEEKRVLEQGSTAINGPHQGGWVELENGENWFLHFQDRGAYGRVAHLNPVRWVDNWPLMGLDFDGNGVGEPVSMYQKPRFAATTPIVVPATSDAFDVSALGLQWQWQANPQAGWFSLTERPGWLRLRAVPHAVGDERLWMQPNQLLQKLPAPAFTATTKIEWDGDDVSARAEARAGLVVMGQNYAALFTRREGGRVSLEVITCVDALAGGGEAKEPGPSLPLGPVWMRVSVEPEARCRFSVSTDGVSFLPIGEAFSVREGRWIGAKVGLVCVGTGGFADFDHFTIE